MNTRNLRFRSNRVSDIIGLFHEELDGMYGSGEVRMFIDMLFEAFLGWDKVRLLTSKEHTVDQSDLLRFHWALEDLLKYRPIQHIIGHVDFCGCRIAVGPEVLIPRPETEEIVNWIVNNLNPQPSALNILDLCTGSGCIAIALKKAFPGAEVTALDVSSAALEMARQNARGNGTTINFIQANLLDPAFRLPSPTFHLIVSNPPYVRSDVIPTLEVPDDDPLCFYQAIALTAQKSLSDDGLLILEINESLAGETCNLLHKHGFSPTLHIDFRGKSRFISAKRN